MLNKEKIDLPHVESHSWDHIFLEWAVCNHIHERCFTRILETNESEFHFCEESYEIQFHLKWIIWFDVSILGVVICADQESKVDQ